MRTTVPVSIIVPVWNGMGDLPACLAALTPQRGIDFEIIVVDDASTDGTAAYIAEHYPQIRLVQQAINGGFVKACNAGLQAACGEILVLLNQDTEVYPNWLVALVAPLLAGSSIGMTGSKALFADGTIQHAGGYIDARGVGHSHAYGKQNHGADLPRSVHYVSGASLAVTRRTYETIGGLDEGFAPAYHEDSDWCRRARRAGLSICYVPDSVLLHKEQRVLLADSNNHHALATLHRNRLRYVLKHWSVKDIIQVFFPAERAWIQSLGWRGETLAAAAQDAYLYHLLHLSEILAARRTAIPTTDHDAEILSALLLQLRLYYPLAPAALTNPADSAPAPVGQARQRLAEDALPSNAQKLPGSCELPGRTRPDDWVQLAYNHLRQRWPRLSLAVVTWPLTRHLARLTHRQLLAEVLLEYIRENSREISRLARELDRLRQHLEQELDSGSEQDADTQDAGDA